MRTLRWVNERGRKGVFTQIFMPLFVAHGIVGVRDMGSDLERLKPWRDEILSGKTVGPRIWICDIKKAARAFDSAHAATPH